MNLPVEPRTQYPALDGLRGIACLIVVFTHNFGFTKYFFFGWIGVDLFFVISGFLITQILLQTRDEPHYLRNFYVRRILRIFPLYYLVLIFFFLVAPRINNFPLDMSYYTSNQWWFWTYLQNWFLIFKSPGNTTRVIQHFWSLAVEEQFYLIWPWVVLLVKKPKYLLALAGVLLLAVIATRFTLWNLKIRDLNYEGLYTFTRIDGICVGSMLAILRYKRSAFLDKYFTSMVLLLAGFNFLFYFFNKPYRFTYPYLAIVGYTTFAVLFALLVQEAVQKENKILNLILGNSLLRFFGKISYSFYVFHWPVYLIFFESLYRWVAGHSSLSAFNVTIVTSVLLTLAGLIMSVFSYYGFERHFLKLKKAFN
jgi:peptidoglycan/LPS O-acetylase OafA/YrhL